MKKPDFTPAHIQTIRKAMVNQLQRAKQKLDTHEIKRIKDVLALIDDAPQPVQDPAREARDAFYAFAAQYDTLSSTWLGKGTDEFFIAGFEAGVKAAPQAQPPAPRYEPSDEGLNYE